MNNITVVIIFSYMVCFYLLEFVFNVVIKANSKTQFIKVNELKIGIQIAHILTGFIFVISYVVILLFTLKF